MTVRELRRMLNELPPEAELWPIGAVDLDQVDVFEIEGVSGDNGQRRIWINVRLEA